VAKLKKPSGALLLWTEYALLVAVGLIAVGSLVVSDGYGKASGGALLWAAFDRLRSLRGH